MLVPNGTYKARAVKGEPAHPDGKSAYVAVVFDLVDEGKQITWFGYLTDKTEQRTVEGLMHAGWTGEDFANLPGLGSKDCFLVIENETYEGKERSKVKWVNSGSVGVKAEDRMNDAEKKGFASRLETLAKGVKAAQPKTSEESKKGSVPF